MKLAVLSDIHSNYEAFKSCIQYLERRKVNAYIFLGDYVGELPCPEKTLKLIDELRKHRRCFMLRGNKEDYIIKGLGGYNTDWDGYPSIVGMLRYASENVSPETVEFFKTLPIEDTIKIDGYPAIRICHGSTDNNKGNIEKESPAFFDNIEEKYILCGHTHKAKVTYIADKIIWNPGSVGLSGSGEMIARCMILHGGRESWRPEYIEVPYDIDAEIKSMREEGLYRIAPYWSVITEDLLKGGTTDHNLVLNKAMELCEYETGHCEWPKIPERFMKKAVDELLYME